jgi:hypothetical protein
LLLLLQLQLHLLLLLLLQVLLLLLLVGLTHRCSGAVATPLAMPAVLLWCRLGRAREPLQRCLCVVHVSDGKHAI